MTGIDLLHSISATLEAAGIPFMLTGSMASAYHGAGRATMDIDLVIDPTENQLKQLVEKRARRFSQVEFERRVPVEYQGRQLPVATVEDVIIAKLEWARLGGSARQITDVAALLRVQGDAVDRAYLDRWVSELGLGAQFKQAMELAEAP